MTRYWQTHGGIVYTEGVHGTRPPSEPWTEVKVVPLDAIVIDRPNLVVEEHENGRLTVDGETYTWRGFGPGHSDERTVEERMTWVRDRAIAVLDFLTAHPPVDEAQVAALTDVLGDPEIRYGCKYDPADVARRLIATGKVQVTS